MRSLILAIKRDPGVALLVLALAAATAIYGATLGRGLSNYDDPWLYQDNAIVRDPNIANVRTVFTELELPDRFTLGAEYLPVRDLSVMADFAVWGERYGGFHLTNLVIYLGAIVLWFAALVGLGVSRSIAGLAVLMWAVHPAHAESVAWLAERKGVLGMMCAGGCAFAYARFRAAGRIRWLIVASVGGVAAVWSKAIEAFAIASLAAIELIVSHGCGGVPRRRRVIGLVTIGVAAGLAYIPVVVVATRLGVVATDAPFAVSRPVAVVGAHGFYLRLAAGLVPNAVAYPIATAGPDMLDVVLGALGFAAVALVFAPRWTSRPWAMPMRIAAVLWLMGWLPIGHLLLPLQQVFVADRYLLLPSLGFTLAIATAIQLLPRLRGAMIAVVVVAFGIRAFTAQQAWRSNVDLWHGATTSNPDDPSAWAMYVEALVQDARVEEASHAVAVAFTRVRTPRLVMHAALVALAAGRADDGLALMTEAAVGGEPRAMANLGNLLAGGGWLEQGLLWARLATVVAPAYANGHRIEGKVSRLIDRYSVESRRAFERAYALEPQVAANRYNLGIALVDAGELARGRTLLESCVADRTVGAAARLALAHL